MLRKLKLYGELAQFIGHKEFEVKVNSISQAISFLICNFPKSEAYIAERSYKVLVGDYEVGEDELAHPIGQSDLHFVPVIAGAGGGTRKILAGAALIGGAFVLGPAGFLTATGTSVTTGVVVAKSAVYVGASLALSGVADLLTPVPKTPDFSSEQDPRLSFKFSGLQNTSRAGTPVPVVYGEIFTGSVVISAGVDTEQVRA
jgi:predicted phage tail protein